MSEEQINSFAVRGKLTVSDSATVLCVRRRQGGETLTLTPEDCGGAEPGSWIRGNKDIFGKELKLVFSSGWEVLMGQAEVMNWLKSSPDKLSSMRYAGEWKLAGGNVDAGEEISAAARRELSEEFLAPLGISVPATAKLRPFVTKQTRPIRSRSNLMHCFVALSDDAENKWLRNLDVEAVNRGLALRRGRFAAMAAAADGTPSEAFWKLSRAEREAVTPEVREVAWMSLRDAVKHALSSMSPNAYVNDFQRAAFVKYKLSKRDPMFITAAILMELEGFPDTQSLTAQCNNVDLQALTKEEQWLFSGMDNADVDKAFRERTLHRINPSFKSPELIAELRAKRVAAAAAAAVSVPETAKASKL